MHWLPPDSIAVGPAPAMSHHLEHFGYNPLHYRVQSGVQRLITITRTRAAEARTPRSPSSTGEEEFSGSTAIQSNTLILILCRPGQRRTRIVLEQKGLSAAP